MFKKLIMALAVVGITAMPFATLAATPVQIESQVHVANTSTNNQYAKTASAVDNQTVAIQVWYHNRENADSGKIAQNIKVGIDMPTAPGKVQIVHSTVAGTNTNTVTDSATINLSLDNANLELIPGSAEWRHNIGDNTNVHYVNTKLTSAQEQALLHGGTVIEDEKPCFNFEATVSILARVKASAVTLQKQVKVDGSGASYATSDSANPGQTLDYVLIVKNMGNTVLKNVQVGDTLPKYTTYINGSTVLVNGLTGTAGKKLTDEHITSGGITIDEMAPGSTQYVYFKVKVADTIPCGAQELKNLGFVKATGVAPIYNQAITTVNVACKTPVTPTPVTPQTPASSLPQTGTESALAGIAGTGVLGYTVQAYRKSKRSLAAALKSIKR